jgi:hypothetical protein
VVLTPADFLLLLLVYLAIMAGETVTEKQTPLIMEGLLAQEVGRCIKISLMPLRVVALMLLVVKILVG